MIEGYAPIHSEKYKKKIQNIIEQKGMSPLMNNTKWKKLKKGVSELPFLPPFLIKRVDEEERSYHKYDEDEYDAPDWGMELECYLGGDCFAVPFFAVEWIKIRPRLLKDRGRLIDSVISEDETEEFVAMLKKYKIPFEEQNGTYIIYGYR